MTNAGSVPESTKASRNLKTVILALALLVIILSATTADLFLQSITKPQSHLSSPHFVSLLTPQDLSTIVVGDWTNSRPPYYISNPTGFMETEILLRTTSRPFFQVSVTVNGFNSSLYSQFAYQNFQLDPLGFNIPMTFLNATVGLLSPSENYTIYGWRCRGVTGNLPPGCYLLGGIAVSSLYVVRVLVTGDGAGSDKIPSTAANFTTVKNLLVAQVLKINSTSR